MSSDRVTAAVASVVAAVAELVELDCDQFTHLELVELLGNWKPSPGSCRRWGIR